MSIKKWFLKIFKLDKKIFFLYGLVSIFSVIAGVVIPYYNGIAINILTEKDDYGQFIVLIGFILGFTLLKVFFDVFLLNIKERSISKILYKLKVDLLFHLRKLPEFELNKFQSNYLAKRIEEDFSVIVGFFLNNYIFLFVNLIQLVIVLILCVNINIKLALLEIMFIPIYSILYIISKNRIYQNRCKTLESSNLFFDEYGRNIKYLNSLNATQKYTVADCNLYSKFNILYSAIRKEISFLSKFKGADDFFAAILQITLLFVGGNYIFSNIITVGELVIVNSYYLLLVGNIKYYLSFFKEYQVSKVSFTRMNELLSLKEIENGEICLSKILDIGVKINSLRRKEVDIIFKLKNGDIIGISGENGIGKTSLIKLLMGLEIDSVNYKNDIYYNNIPLGRIDLFELRRQLISYMPQELDCYEQFVFERFMAQGIRSYQEWKSEYGCYFNIADHKFVEQCWNSRLDELSVGQQRKISIITVVSRSFSVLILDEPTANLDANSVQWLGHTIEKIAKKEGIIIIVTHDERLLDKCSEIIEVKR